jgi:hypothetical protein
VQPHEPAWQQQPPSSSDPLPHDHVQQQDLADDLPHLLRLIQQIRRITRRSWGSPILTAVPQNSASEERYQFTKSIMSSCLPYSLND